MQFVARFIAPVIAGDITRFMLFFNLFHIFIKSVLEDEIVETIRADKVNTTY